MSYETSYDTGLRPFTHDKHRGRWSQPTDFLFACMGHAFKADSVLILPVMLFRELGYYALIPYLLILAICVVPIIFMQSFLGQFSGTGFISVFRIAPLFKGVGYVSMGLNLITLAYFSFFAAIQMFQLVFTLQPTIPWSCEGAKEWMTEKDNTTTICARFRMIESPINEIKIPSVEFFSAHIDPAQGGFSWLLLACTFVVWIMVLLVCLRPVETIGRLMRYSTFGILGIVSLILIRCLFLPRALIGLSEFFLPSHLHSIDSWFMIPWMALGTLGPGWGTILTMASFNHFKTNVYGYSWILSIAQLGIMLALSFICMLMWGFMLQPQEMAEVTAVHFFHDVYTEFLIIPTGLTLLEVPHFWSVIFFVMLFLGSMNLLVVQLLSLLTSVFDEFESLRDRKRDFTLGTVGVLALFSIFFCSIHGIDFMEFLGKSSLMTQMLLNLLLILVVLWIYGRERFQRDVKFMTSRIYSAFMTYIVRFVTPLFLLIGMLIGFMFGAEHTMASGYSIFVIVIAVLITVAPWLLIPWYCIFKLMQTSGVFSQRLRRTVRPTDWYPADPMYKQRYEETFSNPEISHQLTMATED